MRKFSFDRKGKIYRFSNKENEYIDYISKKFNYISLNRESGYCLIIYIDTMEVYNVELEEAYTLYIDEDSSE
jgi:hypothetical protein